MPFSANSSLLHIQTMLGEVEVSGEVELSAPFSLINNDKPHLSSAKCLSCLSAAKASLRIIGSDTKFPDTAKLLQSCTWKDDPVNFRLNN